MSFKSLSLSRWKALQACCRGVTLFVAQCFFFFHVFNHQYVLAELKSLTFHKSMQWIARYLFGHNSIFKIPGWFSNFHNFARRGHLWYVSVYFADWKIMQMEDYQIEFGRPWKQKWNIPMEWALRVVMKNGVICLFIIFMQIAHC